MERRRRERVIWRGRERLAGRRSAGRSGGGSGRDVSVGPGGKTGRCARYGSSLRYTGEVVNTDVVQSFADACCRHARDGLPRAAALQAWLTGRGHGCEGVVAGCRLTRDGRGQPTRREGSWG